MYDEYGKEIDLPGYDINTHLLITQESDERDRAEMADIQRMAPGKAQNDRWKEFKNRFQAKFYANQIIKQSNSAPGQR